MNKNHGHFFISVICLMLFIGISIFLLLNRNTVSLSPWNNLETINWPVYAGGTGERTAIIAGSESSVIVLNAENDLIYRLDAKPGNGDGFSSVQFAEFDENNNLYILDSAFGGVHEQNVERILKYSSAGTFLEEIYAYTYRNADFIITKGKIAGVSYYNGFIYLARLGKNNFYLEQVSTAGEGNVKVIGIFDYPNAFRDLAYIHMNVQNRRLTITEKTGAVKQYGFDGILHYVKEAGGGTVPHLPWTAVSDKNNNIFYADILSGEIIFLDVRTGNETVLYKAKDGEWPYYRINYAGGILFASPYDEKGEVALFTMPSAGASPLQGIQIQKIGTYTYTKDDRVMRSFLFAGFVVAVFLFLFCLFSFLKIIARHSIDAILKTIILVSVCIAFGAVISSVLIVNEMNDRYNEKTYDILENVSRLIAVSVDVELLKDFFDPAQSTGESYLAFKKMIRSQFSQLQFKGKRVYQTILVEKNGIIYMLYDTEDSVGTFFPFSKADGVYSHIFTSKDYERSQAASAEGNWLFVVGPILNAEGEVAALIETGLDLKSVNEQTRAVIWQTGIITGSSAAGIILAVVLFMMFSRGIKTRKKQ